MARNVETNKTPQQFFSERLKEFMRIRNLTTVDIQKATGISYSAISAWVLLKRSPQIDALCLLADYFDCSVDYLLGRSDY